MGTLHQRETFFVGGSYVKGDDGNHTLQGQMYVEHLSPIGGSTKPFPLVFIHGATRSGNDWLTKPDGKPGWASFFLSRGYDVYLVDQPFRGRSAWPPSHGTTLVGWGAEQMARVFTAPKTYESWPEAALHTQWPGTGLMGDPVFDQFFASGLQMVNDPALQERATQAAGAALLDRIQKPVILIGHSQGGSAPLLIADARPGLVRMAVNLEPVGPPFSKAPIVKKGPYASYGVTFAPLTYDPPVMDPGKDLVVAELKADRPGRMDCLWQAETPAPRQLVNLKNIPVLIVTAQASYHAPYDWAIARFLQQAGVEAQYLELAEVGLFGNGHMMFLEKNSDEVAAAVERRIDEMLRNKLLG